MGVMSKMYEYDEDVLSYQDVNKVYANQSSCFRTPRGLVCRDFRRGIECVHPRFGRSFCYRFR